MKKVLAAAVLLMIGSACTPPSSPANFAKCPTAGAGQIQVAVVVEDAPKANTEVVCVVLPTGADGIDALNARATRIGGVAPRIKSFSFGDQVCAIDGDPVAPACGDAVPGGFASWGYWAGGSNWSSSFIGAGDHVLAQGDVEGWAFSIADYDTTFPTAPTTASDFATLTAS